MGRKVLFRGLLITAVVAILMMSVSCATLSKLFFSELVVTRVSDAEVHVAVGDLVILQIDVKGGTSPIRIQWYRLPDMIPVDGDLVCSFVATTAGNFAYVAHVTDGSILQKNHKMVTFQVFVQNTGTVFIGGQTSVREGDRVLLEALTPGWVGDKTYRWVRTPEGGQPVELTQTGKVLEFFAQPHHDFNQIQVFVQGEGVVGEVASEPVELRVRNFPEQFIGNWRITIVGIANLIPGLPQANVGDFIDVVVDKLMGNEIRATMTILGEVYDVNVTYRPKGTKWEFKVEADNLVFEGISGWRLVFTSTELFDGPPAFFAGGEFLLFAPTGVPFFGSEAYWGITTGVMIP